jgi:hypothetical protein
MRGEISDHRAWFGQHRTWGSRWREEFREVGMNWIGVVVVLVGSMIGAGMLVDHRRYRGIPVTPGLSGRDRRRANRQDRAAMTRHESPVRYTGYEGDGPGGG